jgi:hypothetical protein
VIDRKRVVVLAALAAGLALVGGSPGASARAAAAERRDAIVRLPLALRLHLDQWGGEIQASNGEAPTIYFSDRYAADPALARSWADFLTSLVHGPELATVTVVLAPLDEVQQYCGRSALACYSPESRAIVASGTDPAPETTAKGVLIHEYGHHVAASRLNTPFGSGDYGTKRWSSYVGVCSQARAGKLFPGAEDPQHYTLNPGEGFAEAYRVLNEQRLGLPQEAWDIVSPTLAPDATALARLAEDVTQPWTRNTTLTIRVPLTARRSTRTVSFATPLDGPLVVTPTQSGRARTTVRLTATGGFAATRSFARASGAPLSTVVCGQRRFAARVSEARPARSTTVSLRVSRP